MGVPGVLMKRKDSYKGPGNDELSRSCVISMTKDRDREGNYPPEASVTGYRKENPTTKRYEWTGMKIRMRCEHSTHFVCL